MELARHRDSLALEKEKERFTRASHSSLKVYGGKKLVPEHKGGSPGLSPRLVSPLKSSRIQCPQLEAQGGAAQVPRVRDGGGNWEVDTLAMPGMAHSGHISGAVRQILPCLAGF